MLQKVFHFLNWRVRGRNFKISGHSILEVVLFGFLILPIVSLGIFQLIFTMDSVSSSDFSHQAMSVSSRIPASIDRSLLSMSVPSRVFGGGAFVPATLKDQNNNAQKFKVSDFIPLDLKPTQEIVGDDKSSLVFSRIADQSLSTLVNSPEFRASSLGAAATEVEKTVKQEVIIRSSMPKSTEHKFNFQVQAFQSLAKIEYSGFFTAQAAYQARDSSVLFEISEPISTTKKISIEHKTTPSDQSSRVRLSWKF